MKDIFYTKKDRRMKVLQVLLVLLICIIMYGVDVYLNLGYFRRSMIKVSLFILVPFLFSLFNPGFSLFSVLKKGKEDNSLLKSVILGLLVYGFLLTLYVIIKGFIDLDSIESALKANMNVDKSNFVFVALYISFINSFLEEFFFRGFGSLKLRDKNGKLFAYTTSSAFFALYHLSMVRGWTSPLIVVLGIIGLFLSGIFFNLINERNGNIYNSYMVHMFANFAINTIGFQMFGLIDLPFLG